MSAVRHHPLVDFFVLTYALTADLSVLDPQRMMCTYGPAEGSTQSFVHAWLVWVNINAIRCHMGVLAAWDLRGDRAAHRRPHRDLHHPGLGWAADHPGARMIRWRVRWY